MITRLVKGTPDFNPRWSNHRSPAFSTASELEGFVRAGMKGEALRIARRMLKARTVAASDFVEALNAILTLADRVKPWRPLVEAACERLPKREHPAVRFWMMAIRNSCKDHEGVLRLAPTRFTGAFALLELIYSMEATFELGNTELMRRLARRLQWYASRAEDPMTQGQMLLCLVEFYLREGKWDKAVAAAELAQNYETFHRNAVVALVEIHVAQALLRLRRGFDRIEQFKKNFDPPTELMVPGNDAAVQEQAAKEFRRLQRILEKVVPKERQRELGLG